MLLGFIDKRETPFQATKTDGNRILLMLEGRNSAGLQVEWLVCNRPSLDTGLDTVRQGVDAQDLLDLFELATKPQN